MLVLMVGILIIVLGETSLRESIAQEHDNARQIEDVMLQLVNQTNADLISVSYTSIDTLLRLVMEQVGFRMQSTLASTTSSAEFVANQMTDFWRWGYLDGTDFDKTLERLWYIVIEVPSLSVVNFAVAASGAIMSIHRLTDGRYHRTLPPLTFLVKFECALFHFTLCWIGVYLVRCAGNVPSAKHEGTAEPGTGMMCVRNGLDVTA